MGNYELINFQEIFDSYGIDLSAATPEEKERLRLALEAANSMDEFVAAAKRILKGATDNPLKKDS